MDRTVMKVGAAAGMLGAVIAIVFNLLYPRPEDPGSVAEFVQLAATEGRWAITHYLLAWSVGLVLLGLVAISRSFVREPAVSWGRAGLVFAIGGAAFLFTALVILGFSLREAGAANAATAEAVGYVGGGLFLAAIGGFFGLTPLLFGAAVLTGADYPSWLGWVAVVAGALALVTGTIIFFAGFTTLTDMVLFPIASVLFTLWIGIMGYLLWQKASVTVEGATATSA